MMIPEPGVLDRLIRDRHQQLQPAARSAGASAHGLRVRFGRMLISAGSTLTGERVELPARPPALPNAAG
jgi:hypothetical protein